ncbi:MAG: zinc ribbon domain-containing protein [Methanobacterium sp.]|nr:zinc ribbon domain-containing protein [Methanobacterium sp.]
MFCPACGSKNDDEAKFCKKCGEDFSNLGSNRLNAIDRCPYCAEEISPAAKKCKHCGEWLDKKTRNQDTNDYSLAILLGIIFTILGGIIGLIISLYLISRNDKRAQNAGIVLLIVNIVWIFVLLIMFAGWMAAMSYYYY